jgi:hypothetical protein
MQHEKQTDGNRLLAIETPRPLRADIVEKLGQLAVHRAVAASFR